MLDPQSHNDIYGAIDLGTNNCRLVVARSSGNGFKVVDAYSSIVRLGEKLSSSGRLSEGAIQRTLKALRVCAQILQKHHVHHGRFVATHACRQATNAAEFLQRVKKEVGIDLEVISPEQEVWLTLEGCWSLVRQSTENLLLFDIGGGSVEVLWLPLQEGKHVGGAYTSYSWPWGVVSFADSVGGGRLSDAKYQEIVSYCLKQFTEFSQENNLLSKLRRESTQFIGTSGILNIIARMQTQVTLGFEKSVDGMRVNFDGCQNAIKKIRDMKFDRRIQHPSIGFERADLMDVGCAIVDAIFRTWYAREVYVADRNVSQGILLDMMRRRSAALGAQDQFSRRDGISEKFKVK